MIETGMQLFAQIIFGLILVICTLEDIRERMVKVSTISKLYTISFIYCFLLLLSPPPKCVIIIYVISSIYSFIFLTLSRLINAFELGDLLIYYAIVPIFGISFPLFYITSITLAMLFFIWFKEKLNLKEEDFPMVPFITITYWMFLAVLIFV